MDRLKYILVLAFLISYQQITFAQKNNSIIELNEIDKKINESIFISTNTNSFLTGETIYYKIFCSDKITNIATKYSKVAYFELLDSNKKTIFIHKVFLNNGTGNGDFFIPTTIETGIYKIIGYTSWMLNKNPEEYFNSDIYIVNPYKEKPSTIIEPAIDSKKIEITEITNDNISFDLKNKIFNNRTQVGLQVNTNSDDFLKGNYIISVRKTDSYLSQNKTLFNEHQTNSQNVAYNSEIISSDFVLPELRGEIISGRITTSTLEEIKNKKIALSIIGKSFTLKISKTDEQGRFLFNLEKSNPSSNIVVQVVENNKQDYAIEIDKPKNLDFSKLTFSNLQYNSEFKNNITERLISSQIENGYYNIKKDSLLTSNDTIPFFGYGPQAKEYKLDDFTRFKTMRETITEIINGVVFRKNDNNYSIHVYDYDENHESAIPSLIIVDGLIIEDLNEFFTYNPKNIDKVNVVKGLYYYGSKSFNGIVSFTTKNGDYETKLKGNFIIRPELLRPLREKEYFQPNYTNNKNARIPDYRHQLLWAPNVDLSNSKSTIVFYTSDISGKFEVVLEGFSANGKPVYIKKIIEVKDSTSN